MRACVALVEGPGEGAAPLDSSNEAELLAHCRATAATAARNLAALDQQLHQLQVAAHRSQVHLEMTRYRLLDGRRTPIGTPRQRPVLAV